MTSNFLLKGHKMLNFFSHFFLKISETLKAHISGTEQISTNSKFLVFNGLRYWPLKKLSLISMHRHFKFTNHFTAETEV